METVLPIASVVPGMTTHAAVSIHIQPSPMHLVIWVVVHVGKRADVHASERASVRACVRACMWRDGMGASMDAK